ncbi:MAG: imidazole glycerol phosphate synthase subunit HisF [Candidatus Micrarchaeota archaeon]
MLSKRIIPCLDVKDNKVVKGTKFENLKYAGEPAALAELYSNEGADELVFLDITATNQDRKTNSRWMRDVARRINIPFTVGGGISSSDQMRKVLQNGADKVAINSAAIANPDLINSGSKMFGSQCIVVAIDAKKKGRSWEVYSNGGKKPTGKDVIEWAKECEERGAGEILLTSIDSDGTRTGFDLELTKKVAQTVRIPIIASGGAGKLSDFSDVFKKGKADAALAAGLFHYKELSIREVKEYLDKNGVNVRLS